jgi:hypothetical protein
MDFKGTQRNIAAQDRAATPAPKFLNFCEHSNELSGTVKGGGFLVQNTKEAVVA